MKGMTVISMPARTAFTFSKKCENSQALLHFSTSCLHISRNIKVRPYKYVKYILFTL